MLEIDIDFWQEKQEVQIRAGKGNTLVFFTCERVIFDMDMGRADINDRLEIRPSYERGIYIEDIEKINFIKHC